MRCAPHRHQGRRPPHHVTRRPAIPVAFEQAHWHCRARADHARHTVPRALRNSHRRKTRRDAAPPTTTIAMNPILQPAGHLFLAGIIGTSPAQYVCRADTSPSYSWAEPRQYGSLARNSQIHPASVGPHCPGASTGRRQPLTPCAKPNRSARISNKKECPGRK